MKELLRYFKLITLIVYIKCSNEKMIIKPKILKRYVFKDSPEYRFSYIKRFLYKDLGELAKTT